jgi:vacuolar-type H+-ATPase subunit H
MLVEKRAKMTAPSPDKTKSTPPNEKKGNGLDHHAVTHPGADRSNILIAIRQSEASAAKKREAAEKRAEEIRAEGRKAATRLGEDAENEGRALVKAAVEKASKDCEVAKKERLAKAHGQATAITASARVKFPELAKSILQELDRGDDVKD